MSARNYSRTLVLLLILGIMQSCRQSSNTPKPSAYPRIDLPERNYELYKDSCPFSFEKPVYSQLVPSDDDMDCWFNLYYKPFNARLYISYFDLKDNDTLFYMLTEETRNLVYKHTVRANEIDESLIKTNSGINGIYYNLGGNTASAIQFFLTDSTDNYLRGSLYFRSKANRDSLKPMINYLEKDLKHMIKTFSWE